VATIHQDLRKLDIDLDSVPELTADRVLWRGLIRGATHHSCACYMNSGLVKQTSTSEWYIRNCSAYSEPVTSPALIGLVGSQWTYSAADRRHSRHLEVWLHFRNQTPSIYTYILTAKNVTLLECSRIARTIGARRRPAGQRPATRA